MADLSSTTLRRAPSWAASLPEELQTPCFIVSERGIVDNLHATARACGGVERLMPHVKTHRAGWVVERLIREGVTAFKAATVAEVAMVLKAGAEHVVWAYPTVNPAHIRTLLALAHARPDARVEALVDSAAGVAAWRLAMNGAPLANLALRIDLDPDMGRTGAPIAAATLQLARELAALGRFGGWHVYDGHIHDLDIATRRTRVAAIVEKVTALMRRRCRGTVDAAHRRGQLYVRSVAAHARRLRVPGQLDLFERSTRHRVACARLDPERLCTGNGDFTHQHNRHARRGLEGYLARQAGRRALSLGRQDRHDERGTRRGRKHRSGCRRPGDVIAASRLHVRISLPQRAGAYHRRLVGSA